MAWLPETDRWQKGPPRPGIGQSGVRTFRLLGSSLDDSVLSLTPACAGVSTFILSKAKNAQKRP